MRSQSIEPPTPERLEKLVRSAIHRCEEQFFHSISQQISLKTQAQFDQLLWSKSDEREDLAQQLKPETGESFRVDENELNLTPNKSDLHQLSPLTVLKSDPRRLGLGSWLREAEKLQQLRQLNLPSDLFKGISPKVLEIYKQRVAVEPPRELRRHPDKRRYTLLAAFCWLRLTEITDNLVEFLIQIVHRIGSRAERRVEKELLDDFKKVSGKTGLLFQLAEAAIEQPDGAVRDVIYPVVGETTLKNLVREFKSTGTAYREKVYTIMRSSYGHHYRRMIPILLNLLEFRSNNQIHSPVIEALELQGKIHRQSRALLRCQ